MSDATLNSDIITSKNDVDLGISPVGRSCCDDIEADMQSISADRAVPSKLDQITIVDDQASRSRTLDYNGCEIVTGDGKDVIIPDRIARPLVYSAHLLLANSIYSFVLGVWSLGVALFLVYVTSILHWR